MHILRTAAHWSCVRRKRRKGRSRRRDPRIKVHIVHGGTGGLSEFPSIGELMAYLWNGVKERRQLLSGRPTLIREGTHQPQGHLHQRAAQTFALR